MENSQPQIASSQSPLGARARAGAIWLFLFGCWSADVFSLPAQSPPQISPAVAAQLMMHPQTPVDNSQLENVSATAKFDPSVVPPGEKTFYRVTVTATQNSIHWPDEISLPPELQRGPAARGQFTQADGTPFHPLAEFVYEVTPTVAGEFTVSNFMVAVGGRSVEIPAATLSVQAGALSEPPRKLLLKIPGTNLFLGQPFPVQVLAPAGPNNQVDAMRDVQFNGGGFMADKFSTRMSTTTVTIGGQPRPALVYETVLTALNAGPVAVSAQAFTASLFSAGPITISAGGGPVVLGGAGQTTPTLLVSDDLRLNIRPLPMEKVLPGFTGAMGKFTAAPLPLATNRVRLGEPLRLKYSFDPGTNLVRFVPPETPRSREWQIIAGKPGENIFTLIPLTDEATHTPAIPFCAFDFAAGKFYDLTISALPVTVVGDGLPTQLSTWETGANQTEMLKLSVLAATPGKTASSLKPLTWEGWLRFVVLPLWLLFMLWRWDERQRFLEAHPEIVRRLEAKRELKNERKAMRAAIATGDAEIFLRHAATALQVVVAPHFPAAARAMVCGDVLAQFSAAERDGVEGETVRKIFAAADAQFSGKAVAPVSLNLASDVENVLRKLEEKL